MPHFSLQVAGRHAKHALLCCLLLIAGACVRAGETLAEFQGGSIERRDLRYLLRLYHGQQAEAESSTEEQDRLLRAYALQRIASQAAESAGLQNSAEFKRSQTILESRARLLAANLRLIESFADRKLKFYEMQFLLLAAAPTPGSSATRLQEAKDLLQQLDRIQDKDQEVEDLISRKTDQTTYRYLGGYIDPHCVSCQPNMLSFLTDKLKDAAEKKFVIVETPTAIYLIRKYREYEMEPDEVRQRYQSFYNRVNTVALRLTGGLSQAQRQQPEMQALLGQIMMPEAQRNEMAKQQAERIMVQEGRNPLNSRMMSLRETLPVELAPALQGESAAPFAALADDAMLFKVGDRIFTRGELRQRLKDAGPLTPEQELQALTNVILPEAVLAQDSEFASIEESDEYRFALEYYRCGALEQAYYQQELHPAAVTETQIVEWYNLRRQQSYANKSLAEVRASIRAQLENDERQRAIQELQQKLAEKYNLAVQRDRLKANVF
ncbi:MAG: hypothetical protein K1X75_05435 [Leptospirales bacterium]|nr:hypothetical protein [Leptospirales bacterium]